MKKIAVFLCFCLVFLFCGCNMNQNLANSKNSGSKAQTSSSKYIGEQVNFSVKATTYNSDKEENFILQTIEEKNEFVKTLTTQSARSLFENYDEESFNKKTLIVLLIHDKVCYEMEGSFAVVTIHGIQARIYRDIYGNAFAEGFNELLVVIEIDKRVPLFNVELIETIYPYNKK